MARPDFTIRDIINPYEKLGGVVGSMTDKLISMQDAEDKARKEQAKVDLLFAEKQDKVNKELVARDAITNYQSPIGKFGGTGIPTNVLGEVSASIGSRIQDVNSKYKVGTNSPVTSLPIGQQDAYRQEIMNISGNTENVMDRLAEPSSGIVTEGSAEGVILKDLINKGANPKEASIVAKSSANPFSTEKEIKSDRKSVV